MISDLPKTKRTGAVVSRRNRIGLTCQFTANIPTALNMVCARVTRVYPEASGLNR